jgi:hypothetical protein
MGLLPKFFYREAKLPKNFVPRGKQSFPREAKLPQRKREKIAAGPD